MKKGDKVYCKEDHCYNDYFNSVITHKKGKTYEILDISYEYYKQIILIEVEKDAVKEIKNNALGYYIGNSINYNAKITMSRHWDNFDRHFLSQSEYRKLKLQKLSNYERK